MIDAGAHVVVVTHEYGTSAGTGISLDRSVTEVWTLREGRITGIQGYRDRAEALAAVGGERGCD
jgi:hypothetical protein